MAIKNLRLERPSIILQVMIWLAMFLSPLTFLDMDDHFSWGHYIVSCIIPLSLFIVFYANYLWITKYLLKGDKRRYFIINAILIVLLTFGIHEWFNYSRDFLGKPDKKEWERPRMPENFKNERMFFMMLRDIFNLSLAAGVATAITFSLRWQDAEMARKEAETAKSEAELKNLRNQVNPHFLLNTLNNIYALTAFDSTKAQNAIMELSKMMRHVLYDNQQPFVNLKSEIEFLHNYINLMKIRMTDDIEVAEEIHIPEPCAIQVAPLIFMSLVENAFKHGISSAGKSFIHVVIGADNEKIECCIENSNNPKTQSDRSGHGIGLEQVQKRLDMSYPDKYTWEKGVTEDGNNYISKITIYDTKLCNN